VDTASEPDAAVSDRSRTAVLVPNVDLADLTSENPTRRDQARAALDEACRHVGFFQLVHHGVPEATIAGILEALDAFFALPTSEKLDCRPPRATVNRGYAPVGSESLAYSLGVESPPDLFEAFNVGPNVAAEDAALYEDAGESCFAPNIWPGSLPRMRAKVSAYFDAVSVVAHQLTTACASALGIEQDFFESRTDHSTDMMRMNHYSLSHGSELLPGQFGMGPHTDYGILTVLYADQTKGLQIVGPDGLWHDVIPSPGALLVNLGDLLAEWTNDRWRSTIHRVLPPQRSVRGAVRRRSIAFFHDGNYDALIECLPTCISEESPPKYQPVLAGDHLEAKLLGPRTMTASAALSTLGDWDVSIGQ
jgi:isopenicillin N synthase-like dioxygenase